MIVDAAQRSLYRRHGTLTVGDAKLMQKEHGGIGEVRG
jgi:hypothetical protein